MLRIVTGLVLVILNTQYCFAYTTVKTWLDPDFVRQAFLDVALKNEYSHGNKPLVKWTQPIKIWVEHKVADQSLHDELTNAHIRDLSAITNHSIERVTSRNQANIVWIYTRESDWMADIQREIGKSAVQNAQGALCKAGYRINATTHAIDSAAIIIPVDQAREHGKLLACIVEEITQVMGLPNDTETAYPSIFNDETPEDLLSPLDVVLLQMLYEPSLKPGMGKAQVKEATEAILKRYQRQGVLKQAVAVSKSTELFQLTGY
ncbi:DUF2927 domain-containing protein [Vibrio ostreicida]|uniref:DUF2927 domain-containing protein n=1 Tax=Vibrio ostreicida TaxID=526588 RepID=A0ABT8BTF3_9VIBR|nr:DUF2927 domain-containing protein [Vibrio ostreicida]MDN3609709.1 DUF2927 domain-containing protein [Vibrio ostreicida]NPD09461.1 DUF2927 domain-containing protein [Vibrio ostreicida]